MFGEIHLPYIGAGNPTAFECRIAHGLIVLQGLDGGGIPLVKRKVPETGLVQSKGESACTGKKFDRSESIHGRYYGCS